MGELVSIPAERPFAATLARGLLDRYGATGLAGVRLLLPSRRARLVIEDAFLEASGGAPLLLPRLEAVGDVADELDGLDAATQLALPPALPSLRRRFLLFELVRRVDAGLPHEQAFRLADSLAELMDELADEGIALAELGRLDVAAAAAHWQRIALFLDLLARHWAAIETGEGRLGQSERRRLLLETVAERWRRASPGPVVLAGVTGSVPAVAALMATIAELPEGLVVLPGLDTEMDLEIVRDAGPTHPQWALTRLLDRLAITPDQVATWPDLTVASSAAAAERRRLLGAAMRPATAPPIAVDAEAALSGVEAIEAPDTESEALAIALQLRLLLESDGRAVVVSPDRHLARLVSAELARFGLQVEDSGGQPLDQTAPGVFSLLVAHACLDAEPLVSWLALLKHPLARAGRDAGTCRWLARQLDLALRRGTDVAPGWAALERVATRDAATADWFAKVADGTAPLRAVASEPDVAFTRVLDAHGLALQALAADAEGDASELWAGPTGVALAAFLDGLQEAAADSGPIAPAAFAPMLASAMAATPVRRVQTGHPQLELVGRFEARLVDADLVVLAGLNEGVWPETPDPGPWLGRAQRDAVGLPPPEQHVGFAAHDFVQLAASAPRLLLTRSRRDATGGPTVRSRLLDQLDRVLLRTGAGARLPLSPALAWARGFDRPAGAPRPCSRPQPRPPLSARPTRLSVSDVERLLHNPYAVYAERVLGLRPLEPFDRAVDARDRGTLVHKALEGFERRQQGDWPADAFTQLCAEARRVFDPAQLGEAVVALWWPRFVRIARWLVDTEVERRADVRCLLVEHNVALVVQAGAMAVELRGRIDRLDLRDDGQAALYDYKTGTPPATSKVKTGLYPQLPLLGALLRAEGLGGDRLEVERLAYLELRGGEPAGRLQVIGDNAAALADEVLAGVTQVLTVYADPRVPYLPIPRPEASAHPDPMAPLSRDREWTDGEVSS